MKYTRTFSTLGCPHLSLAEVLVLAERFSVGAVELRALERTIDLPAVFKQRYGTPAALAEFVSAQPIKIVSLDTSWSLTSGSDEQRAEFLAIVPWAEAMGVRHLRVFDGLSRNPPSGLQVAAGAVRGWRDLRRQEGWQADLLVETHDVFLTGAEICDFADAAGGVAILWDSHHTWKAGEEPRATWQRARPWVRHIHVKDSISRGRGDPMFDYALPGRGEFPMLNLREALRADAYDGPLSLEWERFWHPELGPLEEALASAQITEWW